MEKPYPALTSGKALIRISFIGICGTDLHAFQGNQPFFTYPRILGHELSGVILDIDDDTEGFNVGDPVVIMPYISCGICNACRSGRSNCCRQLQVLGVHTDGGMQEVISVPTSLLVSAPDLAIDRMAVVEPLSIGAHAVARAGSMDGTTVLVVGCGPIGMGVMAFAKLEGAQVIAMDVNAHRLEFVKDQLDLQHVILATDESINQIAEVTKGELCHAVFDATGNKKAMERGVHFMAHGGQYLLVGLFNGALSFHHPLIHAREGSILCSRNATKQDFEKVIGMLTKDQFPVDNYISHRVPFTHMIEEFPSWLQPESSVMKALVEMEYGEDANHENQIQ